LLSILITIDRNYMEQQSTGGVKKSKTKVILIASLLGGFLLLVGVSITGLLLYQNSRYTTIFSEANSDTVESVIFASEESKEMQKMGELAATTNKSGAMADTDLNELDRLSRQIADRLNEKCQNYDKEFVKSSEVPAGPLETSLLSKDKKDSLKQLSDSLVIQENEYCVDARATAGQSLLTFELASARTDWYKIYNSDYTDTQAVNRLKKYSDGSYEVAYRLEMISASGDKFGEQLDIFTNMYKKIYEYSSETDETLFKKEWKSILDAQAQYRANPLYSGLESTLQQRAKKSLENTLAFYETMKRASSENQDKLQYSSSATTGILLSSCINKYKADLDTLPVASSVKDLVTTLKEKKYLDNGLSLELKGITYTSADGSDGALTITIEATNKSYEIVL